MGSWLGSPLSLIISSFSKILTFVCMPVGVSKEHYFLSFLVVVGL